MNQEEILIWGNGDYLKNVIDKIDPNLNIINIIDIDIRRHGEKVLYGERELVCCGWDEMKFKNVKKIFVSTRNVNAVSAISQQVGMGRKVIHINEEVERYKEIWEKKQIKKFDEAKKNIVIDESEKIHCFVSVTVPISYCNLQCEYCYVEQNNDFYQKKATIYSTEFIRRAFSQQRFGGKALINLCGTGETFLCKGLNEIVKVLLEEGHYVSIISNALIEEPIRELLNNPRAERLFFKCSFHYAELKKKNLLEKYSRVVNMIIASKASCSVELVPHDNLIPFQDEIKEYCMREFGAWPHVTVARDESQEGLPILSAYSFEQYKEIWGKFRSPLFETKMRHQTPETSYCIAGRGTILVDLEHGGCRYCPNSKALENFYHDISVPIHYDEIGLNCKNKYCINSHAYLTLGMIPDVRELSYLDMRDRKCADGNSWVKEPIRSVFVQRVCENLE